MTEVLTTIAQTREWRRGGACATVPTMGALHEGHISLMREARDFAPRVIATVFVNPTQFGDAADLAAYPRTWEADLAAMKVAGVDAVFAPSAAEMYPVPSQVTIDPGPLGGVLEGASRPGHFAAVLTVVAKLIHITEPTAALFGEKDYQQLSLIRRMATDLNLSARIIGVATVRDQDGLALSSRNSRLSTVDRARAAAIPAALDTLRTALAGGATVQHAVDAGLAQLHSAGIEAVDYLVVTGEGLGPVPSSGRARALVAATIGGVRLIDNIAVDL